MGVVFAMMMEVARMLAMENGGKCEFPYVLDLAVYELSHGLISRQARENSWQCWDRIRSMG